MALGVKDDIERITTIWRQCRAKYGKEGPYLFGEYSIADIFFTPVVLRFNTYEVALDEVCSAYVATILSGAALKEWIEAAHNEGVVFEHYEF